MEEFLEKQKKYDRYNETFAGRNSFSKTDTDATFMHMKEDHGFRRFLMRGKKDVKTEFLMLSFGYNINKLHNKIQKDRCGRLLHEIEVAKSA